jgi:hypothetical protein
MASGSKPSSRKYAESWAEVEPELLIPPWFRRGTEPKAPLRRWCGRGFDAPPEDPKFDLSDPGRGSRSGGEFSFRR